MGPKTALSMLAGALLGACSSALPPFCTLPLSCTPEAARACEVIQTCSMACVAGALSLVQLEHMCG